MKILHLCGSHLNGGAARACYRIHQSLVGAGLTTRLRVLDNGSADSTVICGNPGQSDSLQRIIRQRLLLKWQSWSQRGFRTANTAYQSTAWPKTGLVSESCLQSADLIHLHWIGRWLISIEEIGQLKHPLVWTLHDQWPFCGSEHHVSEADHRFVEGYLPTNRPPGESGPDVNRRTWLRKQRHWTHPMHLVAPSRWMAACARRSALMGDWPIRIIPHPLDLQTWHPFPQQEARLLLGLESDRKVILFVAHDGFQNLVKGGDLLLKALSHCSEREHMDLLVIGQGEPSGQLPCPVPIHFLGNLHDDLSIRLAYAAADVLVVPSRQESFCQAATEAQACGRPVVAFAVGGLLDVVADRQTGALAQPFSPQALAEAIDWILADGLRWRALGQRARIRAEDLWAPERVASAYAEVYRSAMASSTSAH